MGMGGGGTAQLRRAALRELGSWASMPDKLRTSLLRRGRAVDSTRNELRKDVRRIITDVQERGDAAILDALLKYDGYECRSDQLQVRPGEVRAASELVPPAVRAAIDDALAHLRKFNRRLVPDRSWSFESEPGLEVGGILTPIESVGLYIPAGKAVYPSVMMQLGAAAVEAGVERIAVIVPPASDRHEIDSAVLYVASQLGIHEIYRVNGPAGVAGLGFGTETLPRVRMVVGPGSPAVACAQMEMQAFGCATVMMMGPSESMILADDSAPPRFVAADLLNEAEHGPDSVSILVTPSEKLLGLVQTEIAGQLECLPEPRRSYAARSIGENGGAILVNDLMEGSLLVNEFAPEHLQVMVDGAREQDVLARIRHAGEILVGQWTPISAANFVIGCPAILPTGGFAKSASGVTALTFLKHTSVARSTRDALSRMSASITALARYEDFPAHEAAVSVRIEPSRSQ